jgi:hypothetical protein
LEVEQAALINNSLLQKMLLTVNAFGKPNKFTEKEIYIKAV